MIDRPQSAADRLRELAGLHDEGLITDDEFNQMRGPLLKELGLPADPVCDGGPDESKPQAVPGPTKPPEKNWISSSPMMSNRGLSFLIVGGGLLVVAMILVWANYDKIEHWAFPERLAYDTGVQQFQERTEFNDVWGCDDLVEAKESVGTDRDKAQVFVDEMNRDLLIGAEMFRTTEGLAYSPEHDEYFLGGYWDEATRSCPEAFDNLVITGRP